MPFPLVPLLIGAGSSALNLGIRALNKPKRPNFDVEAYMRALTAMVNRSTEGTAAQAGQAGAQRAAGQGLTGGAFVQSVNEAEAPAYAAGAQEIARARAEAEMMKAQGRAAYDADRAQYRTDLWGGLASDLTGTAAGTLGAWSQEREYDRLMKAFGQQGNQNPIIPKLDLPTADSELPSGAKGWIRHKDRVVNPNTGEFLYKRKLLVPNLVTGMDDTRYTWASPRGLSWGEWGGYR